MKIKVVGLNCYSDTPKKSKIACGLNFFLPLKITTSVISTYGTWCPSSSFSAQMLEIAFHGRAGWRYYYNTLCLMAPSTHGSHGM